MKVHRVGILGGTFNPVHNGHLMIAKCSQEQFKLDKVVFMPTGHAPHKAYSGEEMSSHRCRMVELAISGNNAFEISLREIHAASVNFTFTTMHQLNTEFPGTQFYFILGADSLIDFPDWRHPELICREAVILAAVRDDMDAEKTDSWIALLTERFGGEMHRLDTPGISVSSKDIRDRVKSGRSVRHLVPDAVAEYINSHKLYR